MADNIELNSGSGGATIKTDDDGTAHWQYVKVAYGPDNTQTIVTAGVGLPVVPDTGGFPVTLAAGTAAIGKLAANSGVDIGDVDILSIAAGDNNIGNVDIVTLPAVSLTGSVKTLLETIAGAVSGSEMQVDIVAALPAGTNAIGTVSLSGSVTALVQGLVAHDAAASGANPVLLGLEARTTVPTAVADGDLVRAMGDDFGRAVNLPFGARDRLVKYNFSASVSSTITFMPAGGAGVFRDLVHISMSNPSATAADVTIFSSLTTGTIELTYHLAASGGGVVDNFTTPWPQTTANAIWGFRSLEPNVKVNVLAVETA